MSEEQSDIGAESNIEAIYQGIYKKKVSGTYSPTLIVGLGGTGIKVLRLMKQHLTPHTSRFVRILGIDSDGQENEKETNYLPVKLVDGEIVILNSAPAVANLEKARVNKPLGYRFILDFLPEKFEKHANLHSTVQEKIQRQEGAGQFRRAGKLVFGANVSGGAGISGRFAAIRRELTEVSMRMEQEIAGFKKGEGADIFVVCSVAGGTGAGCLIDCLALLRYHFNGNADRIRVIAVLPGPALDQQLQVPMKEKPATRGNALGCLRELQAFNLGQIKPAVFNFGPGVSVDLGGRPFANSVYLVDHTQADGTPLNDWHMVCRAAGYFLYSLIGTGVGMSTAGGKVTAFGVGNGEHGAFGVAVLKYPVEEMALYATRYALDQYLNQTLISANASLSKEQSAHADQLLNQMLQDIGCTTSAQIRGRLALGKIPECAFANSAEQEKRLLREPDRSFLSKARNKYNNVDAELARYEASQKKKVADLATAALVKIEALARREATVSVSAARLAFENAQSQVRKLISEVGKRRQEALAQLEVTRKKFAGERGLEAKIDFWDLYMDTYLRREYLAGVNQFLTLSQQVFEDGFVCSLLAELANGIGTWGSKLENLETTFQNLRSQNAAMILKTERRQNRPGLVQHALAYNQFRAWTQALEFAFECGFEADLNQETGLLRTALNSVNDTIRKAINSLHLPDAVSHDPALQKLVRSLNTAGMPLISLTNTAPEEKDMAPQKYVSADLDDEKSRKTFIGMFTPVAGDRAVTHVESVDRNTVVMATTIYGFQVSDWSGFAEAQRAYQQDEWVYGALPANVLLPELASDGTMEANLLRKFGLGLAMGGIVARGANYYINIEAAVDDQGKARYLAPIEHPGASVQNLVDTDLVRPFSPDAAGKKRGEMALLAKGIDSAFDAIREPQMDEFRRAVDLVFRLWRAKVGDIAVAAFLAQFVTDDLRPLLGKALEKSTREQLLDKLIKSMGSLCEELDRNLQLT